MFVLDLCMVRLGLTSKSGNIGFCGLTNFKPFLFGNSMGFSWVLLGVLMGGSFKGSLGFLLGFFLARNP